MNQSDAVRSGAAWLLPTCAFLCVLAVYCRKIERWPRADYDEASLINTSYRAATYGDSLYPAMLSDAYHSDRQRKYPPILAMKLRETFHRCVGFSDHKSRIFSALLLAATCWCGALVLLRATGASSWFATAALLATSLSAGCLVSARSVRFEQEIAFLGFLSFFLPLLPTAATRRSLVTAGWFTSGAAAGMAVCSHPWGVVFPAVMLFTLLVWRSAWRERDGWTAVRRILVWGAGAAIPVAVTLVWMAADWTAFREYVADLGRFYQGREAANEAFFAGEAPDWMRSVLSNRVAAQSYCVNLSAWPDRGETSLLTVVAKALFWLQAAVVVGFALRSIVLRTSGRRLPAVCLSLLPLGFLIQHYTQMPSNNYFLYLALSVPWAFWFVVCREGERQSRVGWKKYPPQVVRLLIVVGVIVPVIYLARVKSRLDRESAAGQLVSLDARHAACRDLAVKLGVGPESGRTIYTDFMTWIVGGRRQPSLPEYLLVTSTPLRGRADGIFLDRDFTRMMCEVMPSIGPQPGTPQEKVDRLQQALHELRPAGIILDPSAENEYLLYLKPPSSSPTEKFDENLLCGVLEAEDRLRWYDGVYQPDEILATRRVRRWRLEKAGEYLLFLNCGPNHVIQLVERSTDGVDPAKFRELREEPLREFEGRISSPILPLVHRFTVDRPGELEAAPRTGGVSSAQLYLLAPRAE